MKKEEKFLMGIYGLLLGLLFILGTNCTSVDKTATKQQVTNVHYITTKVDTLLTVKNVYKYIIDIGVKYPEIAIAQCKLETGNLSSEYCVERHNLFGFRTQHGYMYFGSWQSCCQYYKGWQDKYYRYGKSYYQFLIDINYAEDTTYVNKLKQMVKYGI